MDALKTPIALSLPKATAKRIGDAMQLTGKALPCSVVKVVSSGIVTVKFEVSTDFTLPNVTVPVEWPEYVRYPIQVGCKGLVRPADARLGGVSGLGGGTPDLSQPANLAALAFCALGSADWTVVESGNKTIIYGPEGVIVRDTANGSSLIVTGTDVRIVHGSSSVIVSGSGVAINGTLTINGAPYLGHHHGGVTTGGGTSGGVV